MAEKYFLSTKRVGFRIWSLDDLKLAISLWQDPEVTKYIGGPFDDDAIRHRIEREIAFAELYHVQYWPLFSINNDEFLGCGGLRPYKMEDRIYEIGIHLMRPYWGKGYGSEIGREIIRYGFLELTASAIFAGHNPNNDVSRRLLHQLGFTYSHDEYYEPTGLMHPSYLLTKSDWAGV